MSSRKSLLALLSVVGALAAAPAVASAATVTNTNDSGPGSLRQAVVDAVPGETINVPAGTYTLTSGVIEIEKGLTIAGAGAGSTVIRPGASRAFFIIFAGSGVTISGMTFRDARHSGGAVQGGIIASIESSALTLSGVEFTGNHFDTSDPETNAGPILGGLVLVGEGDLTVLDSRITGNTFDASGANGEKGGTVIGGAINHSADSTMTMIGTSISGNVVDVRGGQGAATEEQDGGFVQGGMLGSESQSTTASTIRSSSVGGNSIDARGGPGGQDGNVVGTVFLIADTIDLTQTTIASNSVRAGATGIARGGGAFLSPGDGGTISVLSSTFAGNSVEAGELGSGGNLVLASARVSFADTVVAGGIGQAGSENCFVAANASVTSRGFNLDSRDQCGFHAADDLVNRDPQLGPLADNGGPTPTMLPAPTSPLVDQGMAFGLNADQRGVPRPIDFPSIPNAPGGDGADIGAVELQPSNTFAFGELRKNRKKGTARLTITLAAPALGTLTLSGKGLKTRTVAVGASPTVTFVVATKGKVKKALRKRGRRKVAIQVTYAPLAVAAVTQTRKTKLVRKQARPKGGERK